HRVTQPAPPAPAAVAGRRAAAQAVARLVATAGGSQVGNLIAGEWRAAMTQATFATQSPSGTETLAQVASSDAADVDAAARAALRAFPDWAALDPKERKRLLLRLADLIEANAEELALVEVI